MTAKSVYMSYKRKYTISEQEPCACYPGRNGNSKHASISTFVRKEQYDATI